MPSETTTKILRIGSDTDCDIVLEYPTVSRVHCELEWIGDRWKIKDLESTNGTFVNGEKIANPRVLKGTDKVTLGRDVTVDIPATPPKRRPAIAKEPEEPASSRITKVTSEAVTSRTWMAPVLFGAPVAILLLSFLFSGVWRRSTSEGSEQTLHSTTPNLTTESSTPATIASTSSVSSNQSSVSDQVKAPTESASAFFAIVVESADGKESRLLGTAVAIDSHRLLTLASIVEAAKEIQSQYPRLWLQQIGQSSQKMSPAKTIIHPKYAPSVTALADFEKALDDKLAQVKTLENPTLEESLDWSGRLEKIMSELASSDMACLVTKETIPKFASINSADTLADSNSMDCELVGFPMIIPSPEVTNELQKYFVQGGARLKFDRSIQGSVLFAETSELSGLPIVSMICLSRQSEVVGLCVRQEPSEALGGIQRCQVAIPEVFWK